MTRGASTARPSTLTAAEDVAAAAQLACLLEVSAPKPGNVHPGSPFADTRYEDFLASAAAIGPAMAAAGARPLGETIHAAVASTRRWTRANTNLGIILLVAPLARAALADDAVAASRGSLRDGLRRTLARTTIADAREVYAAIRLASPGGLGTVETQDVAGEPTVTLVEAMALAADRDAIAAEYRSAFETTFERGAPAVRSALASGLGWRDATVEAFLVLLASSPDTLIGRKLGNAAAADVSRRARAVLDAGGVRSAAGRRAIATFDAELRTSRNSSNPGTTADLTAAALFVVLLEGGWPAA